MIQLSFEDSRRDYVFLAINQKITDQQCKNRIAALKEKYEYSDAYDSTRRYLSEIESFERLLSTRKQYGVSI